MVRRSTGKDSAGAAKFTVTGVPTTPQFEQIKTVVKDSMDALKLGAKNYLVGIYSNLQNVSSTPVFGYLEYENGAIKNDKTENITRDEYLKLGEE